MKFLFLLFHITISSLLFSKNPSPFENEYQTLKVLVNSDLNTTKQRAKVLINATQKAKDDNYLSKGYYMLGFAYMLENDTKSALENAQKSLEIAEKSKNVVNQAIAYRLIGTIYARMNAIKTAKDNFSKALKLIENIQTKEALEVKGLIYNSLLVALGDGSTQNEKLEKLRISKKIIYIYKQLEDVDKTNRLLVSAYTNTGYNFSDLKNKDSAIYYFNLASDLVSKNDSYMLASIAHDKGYLYMNFNEYNVAIGFFLEALTYIKNEKDYQSKKIEILKNLSNCYLSINDIENYQKVRDLYETSYAKSKEDFTKTLDEVLSSKDMKLRGMSNQIYNFRLLIFMLSLILIFIVFVTVYKNKLNRKKFTELTNSIKEKNKISSKIDKRENSSELTISVSDSTIERILTELKNFEENDAFLQTGYTIAQMSIDLGTNTKTLSHVIKNYKNMNFNTYINYLRIMYFIKKSEIDEKYRTYKLSYIAETLGYSSSSSFSKSFKAVTGMLPSTFLKYLKK